MSKELTLRDRMKQYETVTKNWLTLRTPKVIRLDMKGANSFCKGFEQPFDDLFSRCMMKTAQDLCQQIPGVVFAYTQSDKISLVLNDVTEEDKLRPEAVDRRFRQPLLLPPRRLGSPQLHPVVPAGSRSEQRAAGRRRRIRREGSRRQERGGDQVHAGQGRQGLGELSRTLPQRLPDRSRQDQEHRAGHEARRSPRDHPQVLGSRRHPRFRREHRHSKEVLREKVISLNNATKTRPRAGSFVVYGCSCGQNDPRM